MRMRDILNIVSEATIMEVAGSYCLYNPKTKEEIMCRGHEDHYRIIERHPEKFGVDPAKIREVEVFDDASIDYMAYLITKALQAGWVRCNSFKGAWCFQAGDIQTAVKAAAKYDHEFYGLGEIIFDIGMDAATPDKSFVVIGDDEIKAFLKGGWRRI
jgi:hypothetical protein